MVDRFRKLPESSFDVIVVGAGLGGLTSAGVLAKRGYRVLVLDQHYVAGGCATVFKRRGYEFDVGLHYIGECQPGGAVHRMLSAAGADAVEFEELDPDGYDTIMFPDRVFRFPKGLDSLQSRLLEHFPDERAGIERYVRLLREFERIPRLLSDPRALLGTLPGSLATVRWALGSFGSFLDSCTRNPQLKGVLAAQNGDYGLPPSRASTLMGAGLTLHYSHGAFFPRGGGQRISDELATAIERNGGRIVLRARVERIVVSQGRVHGVQITSKHLGTRTLTAPVVISNADLKRTMFELVGRDHLRRWTSRRVERFEMAPALGVAYVGLKRDLRAEGFARSNYWILPRYDFEADYSALRDGRWIDPLPVCVTIASLKDPTNPRLAPPGITNVQVMSIAPSEPERWGVTEEAVRSGAYSDLETYQHAKEAYGDRLLASAERLLPGIRSQIAYREIATPLTLRRYTGATAGTSYGIASTPGQFHALRPGAKTEIHGLYLAGASGRTGPGIVGAMASGMMAAREVRKAGGR